MGNNSSLFGGADADDGHKAKCVDHNALNRYSLLRCWLIVVSFVVVVAASFRTRTGASTLWMATGGKGGSIPRTEAPAPSETPPGVAVAPDPVKTNIEQIEGEKMFWMTTTKTTTMTMTRLPAWLIPSPSRRGNYYRGGHFHKLPKSPSSNSNPIPKYSRVRIMVTHPTCSIKKDRPTAFVAGLRR